jgi:hypothetical protein
MNVLWWAFPSVGITLGEGEWFDWQKGACGAFCGHQLRFRRQTARFLPLALVRSYARAGAT